MYVYCGLLDKFRKTKHVIWHVYIEKKLSENVGQSTE